MKKRKYESPIVYGVTYGWHPINKFLLDFLLSFEFVYDDRFPFSRLAKTSQSSKIDKDKLFSGVTWNSLDLNFKEKLKGIIPEMNYYLSFDGNIRICFGAMKMESKMLCLEKVLVSCINNDFPIIDTVLMFAFHEKILIADDFVILIPKVEDVL